MVDPEIRSDVVNGLVMLGSYQERPASEMIELAREAIVAARAVPHSNALAVALNNLAVMLSQNDSPIAEVLEPVREGAALERTLDAGTGTRLNLAVLLVEILELHAADQLLMEVRSAAADPRNVGMWWDTVILSAGERGRLDDVADAAAEVLRLLHAGEAWLPDDQLGPLARELAEWGSTEDAKRVLARQNELLDAPAQAWIALREGDLVAARAHLGDVHPETDRWWFAALAAEIELADGHPERVEDLVRPALGCAVEGGRLRAERRLLPRST